VILGGLLTLLIVGGMIVGEDTAPTTETGSSRGSEGRQKPPEEAQAPDKPAREPEPGPEKKSLYDREPSFSSRPPMR
jgi:hypothetical protein